MVKAAVGKCLVLLDIWLDFARGLM